MITHQQLYASTASPYKFPRVAVSAVTGKDSGDDFKAVEDLHQLSGVDIPAAVDGLERAEVRHKTVSCGSWYAKSKLKAILVYKNKKIGAEKSALFLSI